MKKVLFLCLLLGGCATELQDFVNSSTTCERPYEEYQPFPEGAEYTFPVSMARTHSTYGLHEKNSVDIPKEKGAPVLAFSSGEVVGVEPMGEWYKASGNLLVLKHSLPTFYTYFTRSTFLVSVGDHVQEGQILATADAGTADWRKKKETRARYHGEVVSIEPYGEQRTLTLKHEGVQFYTFYAHLESFVVSEGEYVEVGEPIATVGSTGYSTGPHLHFGICGFKNPYGSRNFYQRQWISAPSQI